MADTALVYRQQRRLTRTSSRRIFAGVCSGLARFTGINRWVFRIIATASIIGSGGILLLFYFLTAFIIPEDTLPESMPDVDSRVLRRSRSNRLLGGVCGGLGGYMGIDPTIVRVLWVLASFGSMGLGVLLYFALTLALPKAKLSTLASLGGPVNL